MKGHQEYNTAYRAEVNATLAAASWSGGVQTVTNAAIDPARDIFLTYDPDMDTDDYAELQAAQIRVTDISSGSLELTALGTVPVHDLDIILVVR